MLFLLYIADLNRLIVKYGLHRHLYADEMQIHGFCPPAGTWALLNRVAECINDVSSWNSLQINTAKTEALWCTSACQQHCSTLSRVIQSLSALILLCQ